MPPKTTQHAKNQDLINERLIVRMNKTFSLLK